MSSACRRRRFNSALLPFTAFVFVVTASISSAQSNPPESTFFSTVAEVSYSTYQMQPGDGDLWPSCWAKDGSLYAANGDGKNFGSTFYDMAVARISGMPPHLQGTLLAGDVGKNYSGEQYNDKPTGMLCVDGDIYLAFQNLNRKTFQDAPAASIVKSSDHGVTWTANPPTPMFGAPQDPHSPLAYKFTTIFFLDYGQESARSIDQYVYVYGLDNNWRDETKVFLARVPKTSILNRTTWQFFSGMVGDAPSWSPDISRKVPVLTDDRELYQTMLRKDLPAHEKVIGQGGVVYDAPLKRYLMISWSWSTHELYESPEPWGPWKHAASKDFGPLRLLSNRGQYGSSIPSKFISEDGKTVLIQSNICCTGNSYTYSLRKLYLEPYKPSTPVNIKSPSNLALVPGARAISKSTHYGRLCARECANQIAARHPAASEDDFDEENKAQDGVESFWGYVWPRKYTINRVTYTTGTMFPDGGWFARNLRVQVRNNFQWTDVAGVRLTPSYPYTKHVGTQKTYTFEFPATQADGVRIIGVPGGSSSFTSINSLGVYHGRPSSTR